MSTIHFRQVNEPYREAGAYWHVEFYLGTTPLFPVGMAIVCAPCGKAPTFAHLNMIFVVDQWRGQGIGAKLLAACIERWPDMQAEPMDGAGAGLLKSYPQFQTEGE